MILQTQSSAWSCLPTAFAMALSVHVDALLSIIGHDGSEIIWPELRDPERRRSFHIQEMVWASHNLGYSVTPHEARPTTLPHGATQLLEIENAEFETTLRQSQGVLTGVNGHGLRHAVAWDGNLILDPNGITYHVNLFEIETFWLVSKR